ncbi:GL24350 [Drosophila persimilis]|uniref:non-specific serine/threonine protein kinase n=1 Tax=Drosophila persimilis TaxID=7234 RepID=B4G5F9_DROPE|nr:GL24350 [Drosophila persimilis]
MQLLNFMCLKQKVAHIANNNNNNSKPASGANESVADPRDSRIFGCFVKKEKHQEEREQPSEEQQDSGARESSHSGSYNVQQEEKRSSVNLAGGYPSIYRQQDEEFHPPCQEKPPQKKDSFVVCKQPKPRGRQPQQRSQSQPAISQQPRRRPGTPPPHAAATATAKSMTSIPATLSSNNVAAAGAANVPEKQPWPNSKDDYELRDVIGVGATAVVHGAYCIPRNENAPIKRINVEKWNHVDGRAAQGDPGDVVVQPRERGHLPHIVCGARGAVAGAAPPWRAAPCWTSSKHKMRTSNCKQGVFDEATIATVLKEVLKGLEYFHSNGQIHRDIKAGNILIGDDGTIQIADFGVSAWLATGRDLSRQKVRHTFVGTPCWMAPEVMEQDHGYDFKADIWSFGITAIEMATGTAPYHKYPPMKVLMLTLQNDPPTLDTGADDKDQYKAYGKTFRKMIVECLQKEPSKRPTASELLKHAFFKKVKDRKYLTQTLLQSGPSMETRVHKAAKRQPGASGRLHRTVTGEWVWSSEEEDNGGTSGGRKHPSSDSDSEDRPMNRLERADSSDSDREDPSPEITHSVSSATVTPATAAAGALNATAAPVAAASTQEVTAGLAQMPLPSEERGGEEAPPVNLVLRMRNLRRELHDIRFEFMVGKDTAEGIATELVDAGLVDALDTQPMAQHLDHLIAQCATMKTITFQLSSGVQPGEVPDERSLVGYAQISITD